MRVEFTTEYQPKLARLVRISLFSVGCLALLVNIIILMLVKRMRQEFHRLGFKLIAAVAIIDLLSGINSVLSFLFKYILGFPGAFDSTWFCPVFNFFALSLIFISGFLMALLAVDRYLLVCRNKILSSTWTFYITLSSVILYIIPALGTSVQNSFAPDPLRAYCIPYGSNWARVCNCLILIGLLVTLIMVTFSYTAITYKVYRRKFNNNQVINTKVALKSAIIILMYSCCFIPKFIVVSGYSIFVSEAIPDALEIIAPIGINMLAVVNPFLILFLHTQFRNEVKQIFRSPSLLKSSHLTSSPDLTTI